ncbi:9545_t:CDS:1 [Funneliformis caledonium]|uniref:9545_t:CDS:1 n=1 Tax=Funneliformis caledonium TaxID=1117310 RepID=A0A9N9DZG3_9GLOM|nr:9545_t:CDS:1 [Funneliformis caledonium]
MARLTHDCLLIVFKELKKDIRSLFSCLLVNRLWCETAVPILWKNPWALFQHHSITNNYESLYNTIISLLPQESKDFLIQNNIDLPSSYPKPLINYIRFFQHLDDKAMMHMSGSLIFIYSQTKFHIFLIEQEILKMIMSQSQRLKNLSLKTCKLKHFHYFSGATECLKNLVVFECNIEIDPSIFYGLAQICHKIKKLYVYNCYKDNDGLISLIEVQKKLQHFTCEFNSYMEFDYPPCRGIENALIKQANSLISFNSQGQLTLYHLIYKKLVNLRYLKVFELSPYPEQEYRLKAAIMPNLQKLHMNYFSLPTIIKIIESTKGNLKEIRIESEQGFSKENTTRLIQAISKNCPNLMFTTILCYGGDDDNVKELEKLFSACSKLEKIVLVHDYFNTDAEDYDDELLNVLVKHAPLNLISLKLECFKFSTKNLERFFKRWKEGRRHSLSIYNLNVVYEDCFLFNDEQIKLVNKYEKEGVIKEFKEIDSDYERFVDWEL